MGKKHGTLTKAGKVTTSYNIMMSIIGQRKNTKSKEEG